MLIMEIFDLLNFQLQTNPEMLAQLAFAFKIKYWLLIALAFYFIFILPYRDSKKEAARDVDDDNQFFP